MRRFDRGPNSNRSFSQLYTEYKLTFLLCTAHGIMELFVAPLLPPRYGPYILLLSLSIGPMKLMFCYGYSYNLQGLERRLPSTFEGSIPRHF